MQAKGAGGSVSVRERRLRWAVPLAWLAVGLLLYGWGLGSYGVDPDEPEKPVFDELNYLRAARHYVNGTWMDPAWGGERPYNWEHPPLGKLWMWASIELVRDDEEVYRAPSVLHGAAGLAGLAVLGRRLFGSHAAGVLAPLMLALDPMWYVESRLALLEVYVAAPAIWSVAFALGVRPWERWAAGGALGYALAAKYTALFLMPAVFLILLVRDLRGPADALDVRSVLRALGRTLLPAVALPLGIFLVSYAPFLLQYARRDGLGYMVTQWVEVFVASLGWGTMGPDEHPETTPPLLWIPMARPTWFWVDWGEGTGASQTMRTIYAIGNPVVWWGGILLGFGALVFPALRLLARVRAGFRPGADLRLRVDARDVRVWSTMGLAVLIFVGAYAPFFLVSRVTFLYYMGFLSPWLALMLGGGLAILLHRPAGEPKGATAAASPAVATANVSTTPAPQSTAPSAVPTDNPPQMDEKPPAPLSSTDAPERTEEGLLVWARRWTSAHGGTAAAWIVIGAAAFVALYWLPLYAGLPYERATVDQAWSLVPWMERLLGRA